MCGIAGFWDHNARASRPELLSAAMEMANALSSRGPDDCGVWAAERSGFAFGHRRLSILDVSPLGHQPMVSACGRYVISFNGEIYNFQHLRKTLESAGHSFRGNSDTEVLLTAIADWGLEVALRRSDGMFAFALWDIAEETLYLCRDRFGEKPLYYGISDGILLFASELKALWRHPAFDPTIDPDSVAQFFTLGCVPAPRSIFKSVRKLEPANILRIRGNDMLTMLYWSISDTITKALESTPVSSEPEAIEELDSLLRASVRSRTVADVPVGVFLSGGLDSTLIAAVMRSVSSSSIRTFTVGFAEQTYNETDYAAAAAQHIGARHDSILLRPVDVLEHVPAMSKIYDEPFADVSAIPTFLVSMFASRDIKVALTGDASDELFGGYRTYANAHMFFSPLAALPGMLRKPLRALLTPFGQSRSAGATNVWNDRLNLLFHAVGPRPAARLHNAIYCHRFESRLLSPRLQGTHNGHGRLPEAIPRHLCSIEDAFMYYDQIGYLPDNNLAKVDRAAMANSIETRLPFLDPAIFEFSWRVDRKLLFNGRSGKSFLRKLLARYVPADLAARPKSGFDVPIREWLAGPLREWSNDILSDQSVRRNEWLDAHCVAALRKRFAARPEDAFRDFWHVLVFHSWYDHAWKARGERAAHSLYAG
jgi:asparagine synthase (glutamine-hydrolysing)